MVAFNSATQPHRSDDRLWCSSCADLAARWESRLEPETAGNDARDRRTGKVDGGGDSTDRYDEDQQLIEEYDGAGDLYIHELILFHDLTNGDDLLLRNHNFNVVALAERDTGDVVERYEYTPYGERTVLNADFTTHSDPIDGSFAFAIGHQGLMHDVESGLVYNRARMLHAGVGRFVQRDPLGYVDGMSVYAAYHVMWQMLDPWGLESVWGRSQRERVLADISGRPYPVPLPGNPHADRNRGMKTPGPFQEDDCPGSDLDNLQLALDLGGLVPGLGLVPDLANAGISALRGNWGDAGLSLAAAVPLLGHAATAGKLGNRARKAAPDFVVSPGGTAFPVPQGARGPFPADSGKGFQYSGGSGGHGLSPRADRLRIMDSTDQYPTGYGSYSSGRQTINPHTGRTISPSDPSWHIPAK